MPVYLSFLVCALGATSPNSTSCYVTVPYTEPMAGLAACQIKGEVMAAEFKANHHGWKVSRIRCTLGSRPQPQDQA